MGVLLDTSVWINYFNGGTDSDKVDLLIDENLIVINDIVLAELVPYLTIKKQFKVIKLLNSIRKLSVEADWNDIIGMQVKCLKAGMNGIGIPDLLIAQNAKKNNCSVYSLDKHFQFLKNEVSLKLHL